MCIYISHEVLNYRYTIQNSQFFLTKRFPSIFTDLPVNDSTLPTVSSSPSIQTSMLRWNDMERWKSVSNLHSFLMINCLLMLPLPLQLFKKSLNATISSFDNMTPLPILSCSAQVTNHGYQYKKSTLRRVITLPDDLSALEYSFNEIADPLIFLVIQVLGSIDEYPFIR